MEGRGGEGRGVASRVTDRVDGGGPFDLRRAECEHVGELEAALVEVVFGQHVDGVHLSATGGTIEDTPQAREKWREGKAV